MNTDDKEIYLRVLNDVSFMLEILMRSDNEADTFTVEMLRQRILCERNAFNVEEDRRREEDRQRQIGLEELREIKSDD